MATVSWVLSWFCLYRVRWSFVNSNNKSLLLTEGFYEAKESEALFKGTKPKYSITHVEKESVGVIFYLNVTGADRYYCSQLFHGVFCFFSQINSSLGVLLITWENVVDCAFCWNISLPVWNCSVIFVRQPSLS